MRRVEPKPQSRPFQSGDVIAERYELRELVGEGGMGAVWRARHIQLESDVALKLMSAAIAAQPDALHRFLREARAAARLTSSHVVKVFDYGVDGETPFIAMELLAGESLRQRLDREGALSPAATLSVIRHATRALSKAHAEGIVHRDLKPENLFLTQQEEEVLKVLDFGVAKLSTTTSGGLSTSTRTGAVLGTPFYMSPEQARGIKAVDHRSDIWSLGVIAFECLTGKLPFDSEGFGDLVLKICTLPPPVPSAVAAVPAGFDAWFARVVERDPEQRYQSVDEMLEVLQGVLGDSPAVVAPTSVQVAASGSLGRAGRPAGTLIDVTASQSVMAHIPKSGLSPRAWLLSLLVLVGLLGIGALLLFGLEPAATLAGSGSAAQPASANPGETLGAGVEATGASEPPPLPVTEDPVALPSTAAAVPAVAPAADRAAPSLTPTADAMTSAARATSRAAAAASRSKVRPAPAPAPAKPTAAKPPAPKPAGAKTSKDLFSDPD
jgi:serine/threonine-protein kinase